MLTPKKLLALLFVFSWVDSAVAQVRGPVCDPDGFGRVWNEMLATRRPRESNDALLQRSAERVLLAQNELHSCGCRGQAYGLDGRTTYPDDPWFSSVGACLLKALAGHRPAQVYPEIVRNARDGRLPKTPDGYDSLLAALRETGNVAGLGTARSAACQTARVAIEKLKAKPEELAPFSVQAAVANCVDQ